MARAPKIPSGAWPMEMGAELAAGYCGEPSVDSFLAKVRAGQYSQPARAKGFLPKWHRAKLDRDIAHRHGLQAQTLTEDIAGLIG